MGSRTHRDEDDICTGDVPDHLGRRGRRRCPVRRSGVRPAAAMRWRGGSRGQLPIQILRSCRVTEAPALVAFAATVASGESWLYGLGAFFAAIGFARAAPTAGHIAQDQEELRRRGSGLLLLPALARARQGQPYAQGPSLGFPVDGTRCRRGPRRSAAVLLGDPRLVGRKDDGFEPRVNLVRRVHRRRDRRDCRRPRAQTSSI